MREKSHELAIGGIFAAVFIVISLLFVADVRAAQSIMQLLKVVTVAVYAGRARKQYVPIFAVATICIGLMLLPLNVSIIYNIPAMIYGIALSWFITFKRRVWGCTCSFIVNSIVIVYEYLFLYLIIGQNMFVVTKDLLFSMSSNVHIAGGIVNLIKENIIALTILFLLMDSLVSSVFVYYVTNMFCKRIGRFRENT